MPTERCACCNTAVQSKARTLSSIIIFKDTYEQETMKKCIEQLTGLPDTDLNCSDQICETCEKELVISYKFRLKVLKRRDERLKEKTAKSVQVVKDEPYEEVILAEVTQFEHDYGELQIIKEDECNEEEDIEVETADLSLDECKMDEDYIEEEYLEEDVPTTPRKKLPQPDVETPVDASQPKLNAEMAKLMKSRSRGSSKTWNCTKCDYKSKHSKKDLRIHMLRLHFPEEMYIICEICNKSFATSSELKTHTDKYHSDFKVAKAICSICNLGFTTGTKLHAHMLSEHADGERIPCDICDATFKTSANLRMHKKLHEVTDDIHECPICYKTFRVSYYLTKHIKDAHSSNPKIFTCNECGRTAKSKKDMRLHLTRRHFPECKSYLCVDCGKMFESSHRLSDHIRSWHNREYRYECDICQRKFIHPASLRIHKSTHSTTSPFSCDECGASFKNMIYLTHHKKIHVATKDFGCSQCPQFFKTKGYLQTHIKNCHPTQELICQICGTTYKNLLIFKSHLKMHQNGKSACEVCGKAYASENNLRLHKKNAHGLTAKSEKYFEVMVEAD